MSVTIETPETVQDRTELEAAIIEYLGWCLEILRADGAPDFDLNAQVGHTLDGIEKYLPPRGRLFLARDENGALVGMAFLKMIRPDVAEIKRLYVRSAGRGKGLGRKLSNLVVASARELGAKQLYLDTLLGMTAARALYADMGFREIPAYPETENPPHIHPHTVFMALDL